MVRRSCLLLAVTAMLSTTTTTCAFSTTSSKGTKRVPLSQHLFPSRTGRGMGNTQYPPSEPEPSLHGAYGEGSRKFRRTVYTHADWVKHRSPDRFFRNVLKMRKSGIYKNISQQVVAATIVAAVVCAYNFAIGPKSALPKMGLPLTPFTLSSPSLGLLLVFRTNTSYGRWDEARKNWGLNINRTRDLMRMANAFYDQTGISDEQRTKDLNNVSMATWAFVRSMKRHLSPPEEDERDFQLELLEKLPRQQAEHIIDSDHRPNRALYDLSIAIENLPMHFMRKHQLHLSLTTFEDTLGGCERLLSSPVPLFYTRHLTRFLSFWMFLLPLGLYDAFKSWHHIMLIPSTALISLFLFGIEELSTQLEEPFTILPMQAFCDKIGRWINDIASFRPGDNGIEVRKPKPEHANGYFDSQLAMKPNYLIPPTTYGAVLNGRSSHH